MKRLVFISLITVLAWILLLLFIRLGKDSFDSVTNPQLVLASAGLNRINTTIAEGGFVRREDITFILGEDNGNENSYYTVAEKYYKTNPKNRTEFVVTTCRSLVEVRNYLFENKPPNGLPWGRINLVAHGNPWQGLGVPVSPGNSRSTPAKIAKAGQDGILTELDDKILDEQSEIFIHACGLGNNAEWLKGLGTALGGDTKRPKVIASRFYEIYASVDNGQPQRQFAETRLAFYKIGYRPGDIRLARQLAKRYPDDNTNWRDVLKRTEPAWEGEVYHYTFNIPVKWIVMYSHADSVPEITSKEQRENWIENQSELIRLLTKMEIPPEKFDWRFRKIRLRLKDGSFRPAIRAKGYCTVLCVLKPLIVDDPERPENYQSFEPDESDTTYFGIY